MLISTISTIISGGLVGRLLLQPSSVPKRSIELLTALGNYDQGDYGQLPATLIAPLINGGSLTEPGRTRTSTRHRHHS